MPSSPLLNLSPRRPLHGTGPTSPKLTRSEPRNRVPRSALQSKANARTRTQSLHTEEGSCALPPVPPRNVSPQSRSEGNKVNLYDPVQPLGHARTPGHEPPQPGGPVTVFQYAIPSTGKIVTPPAATPTVYADLQFITPPQTPNRYKHSGETPETRSDHIYIPLASATHPMSPKASSDHAYSPGRLRLPTAEQAPRSNRMTVASVGDLGQRNSQPVDSNYQTNVYNPEMDATYDQLREVTEYVNTARLSTYMLDNAWAPRLPPRRDRPPPVAPKPDYLHSRNPFAKPGPIDPYVGSGAVVGLTKRTFKKFIRDLDAAFVLFYNPCDNNCCGAKVHMRQAAHTTQKPNHVYAAVDCTKECKLCKKQNITTFPTMKLFVKGMIVDTYTHVPLMTNEIRSFVENAPLVRETVLEKSRCVVQ